MIWVLLLLNLRSLSISPQTLCRFQRPNNWLEEFLVFVGFRLKDNNLLPVRLLWIFWLTCSGHLNLVLAPSIASSSVWNQSCGTVSNYFASFTGYIALTSELTPWGSPLDSSNDTCSVKTPTFHSESTAT